MAKKILKLGDEDIEPVCLIGIAGTIKYYKVCYYLNKIFGIDFEQQKPITAKPPITSKPIQFLRLCAHKEHGDILFEVILNKAENESLLAEANSYELLLKINKDLDDKEIKKLCSKIKQIQGVLIATKLNVSKIKHFSLIAFSQYEIE